MGIENLYDPDSTYQLTEDNLNKLLAIHMRLRTNMPIIIMGETGCGKTRMVKFLCDLHRPPDSKLQNMFIVKVHGGTTEQDIERCLAGESASSTATAGDYKDAEHHRSIPRRSELYGSDRLRETSDLRSPDRPAAVGRAPEDHLRVQPVQKALGRSNQETGARRPRVQSSRRGHRRPLRSRADAATRLQSAAAAAVSDSVLLGLRTALCRKWSDSTSISLSNRSF